MHFLKAENIYDESENLELTNKINRIKRKEKENKKFGILDYFLSFISLLIPCSTKMKSLINCSPGLRGSFCISSIIVILLSYLFKDRIILYNDKTKNNIVIFFAISYVIYFFVFGLSFTIFLCFFLCRGYVNYKHLVSIFSYSLGIFVPFALIYFYSSKLSLLFCVILFGLGIYSLFLFIIFNFSKKRPTNLIEMFMSYIFCLIIIFVIIIIICQVYLLRIEKILAELNPPRKLINVATKTNDNYIYPTLVLITSLMENIGLTTFYHIYIMISNDNNKNNITKKFNTLITKYGNDKLNITYLFINYSEITMNKTLTYAVNKEPYYNFMLASLLPNVSRIIYINPDVINFQDLTDFYNIALPDDIYICAALSNQGMVSKLKNEFGIKAKYDFNTEILLMNLESIRKYDIEKKLIDLASTHHLSLQDSLAINAICYYNNKILLPKYSLYAFSTMRKYRNYNNRAEENYRYSDDELEEAYYSPVNLFYLSPMGGKPWNRRYLPQRHYWWYYANKTDFLKEIINFANYDQNKVNHYLDIVKNHNGYVQNYRE